jgi:TPR repeat protein
MDKSAKLLRAAAEAGDTEAHFALGLLYLLGRGVEKDAREALRLFTLAQDAGDAQASHFRDMAAEQMAQNEDQKRDTETAANAALKEAQRRQRFPKPKLVEDGGKEE